MAVRARADPPPVPAGPVELVVPAPGRPVARPVGHLVPVEAGLGELLVGEQVLVREVVLVRHRQLAPGDPAGQGGARLDDQGVRRQVVGVAAEGDLDARSPSPPGDSPGVP